MDSLIKDDQFLHLSLNRSIDRNSLLLSPFPMVFEGPNFVILALLKYVWPKLMTVEEIKLRRLEQQN